MKRHDHRQSIWIICNGEILWCYRCGAWHVNRAKQKGDKWYRPVGLRGVNPAMREIMKWKSRPLSANRKSRSHGLEAKPGESLEAFERRVMAARR